VRNFPDDGWVRAEDALPMFSEARSFVCGDGLPRVSASYWFCAAERRVRGEVAFGIGAEGMPGCVHGGAISGVFDEALGLLSWAATSCSCKYRSGLTCVSWGDA
jgi:hypothetical protein